MGRQIGGMFFWVLVYVAPQLRQLKPLKIQLCCEWVCVRVTCPRFIIIYTWLILSADSICLLLFDLQHWLSSTPHLLFFCLIQLTSSWSIGFQNGLINTEENQGILPWGRKIGVWLRHLESEGKEHIRKRANVNTGENNFLFYFNLHPRICFPWFF